MANQYAISAGHDNEVGLDLIDEILVTGRRLLSSIEALGEFDDGLERAFIGGNIEDVGTVEWDWNSASMWPGEYKYIRDTYLGGLRSGPVTVRTRLNGGDYVLFNATLTLPKRGDLRREDGGWYKDLRWRFTSGEELPE